MAPTATKTANKPATGGQRKRAAKASQAANVNGARATAKAKRATAQARIKSSQGSGAATKSAGASAPKRSKPAKVTKGKSSSMAKKAGKKTAAKGAKAAAKSVTPGTASPGGKLARKAGKKLLAAMARRTAEAGSGALRRAVEQTAAAGRRAFEAGLNRRLPIQVSIDVAVPLSFVWEEWMTFESLCEGVDRIEQVERDGDVLYGQIAGPRPRDWVAEVLDERSEESFAWRSVEGSDCAGLVTFHALSERLTRIEVDLDVVPTGPVQTVAFASHMAHRRAEAELRRFKARLEFINPDVYEPAHGRNGSDPHGGAQDDGEPEEDSDGTDQDNQ